MAGPRGPATGALRHLPIPAIKASGEPPGRISGRLVLPVQHDAEGLVIMMVRATPPLMKTETAADYVRRHARNPLTRAHTADVQQANAACRAADDPVDADAVLTGLLTEAAECAGSDWPKPNGDDPDVARFTALPDSAAEPTPAGGCRQASDLDDMLAAVLWAAHGPQ